MEMTHGNRAILEHAKDGKALLLFESLGKSQPVKFLGEFICESYREIQSNDKTNTSRKAIVFQLKKADFEAEEEIPAEAFEHPLEELRKKAYKATKDLPTTKERTSTNRVRERQKDIKVYALKRAEGQCECCNSPAPFTDKNGQPFFEVHHITRLSDNGLDSPKNVAAVTPNCHRKIHHSTEGKAINKKLSELILVKELQYGEL